MKTLLTFVLCLLSLMAQAANPSTKSFRGTGGILVTSNDVTALITIDGSGISAGISQPPSAVLTNLANVGVSTTNVVWVSKAGKDSTGVRCRLDLPFASLTAAKNAALSGDRVHVLPGKYLNGTNLLKNGVTWWFDLGAVVTNSAIAAAFSPMFTDNNVGISNCSVGGYGTFVFNTLGFDPGGPTVRYGCIFQTMNAGTEMNFDFDKMYDLNVDDNFVRNILISNCALVRITGTLNNGENTASDVGNGAFEYDGGVVHYNVSESKGDKDGAINVQAAQPGTNYLFVTADVLSAVTESAVKIYELGSNYYTFIKVGRIYGGANPHGCLYMGSGHLTMDVDLVQTPIGTADFNVTDAAVYQYDGDLVFRCKRFENSWRAFTIRGGTFNVNIDELVDMGGKAQGTMRVTNAMGYIRVGRSYQTNGYWMEYGGTNVTVDSSYVNMVGSAATNWAVNVFGAGLKVRNSTFVTPAAAFSLNSGAAQTVKIYGSYATRPATNNVTVQVGPWTVDTNVQ